MDRTGLIVSGPKTGGQGFMLGSRTVITTTGAGTYTVPTKCRLIVVECIGGGSGGAATANSASAQMALGSGGSSGTYSAVTKTVTSGQQFAVNVSAGGASNANGSATTFGSICSGEGGSLGTSITTGTSEVFTVGSFAAQGSNIGDFSSSIAVSDAAHRVSGSVGMSGAGAQGPMCSGKPLATIAQGNGAAGGKFGAGGSGGLSVNAGGSTTGGHGGQGVIIVWEFY